MGDRRSRSRSRSRRRWPAHSLVPQGPPRALGPPNDEAVPPAPAPAEAAAGPPAPAAAAAAPAPTPTRPTLPWRPEAASAHRPTPFTSPLGFPLLWNSGYRTHEFPAAAMAFMGFSQPYSPPTPQYRVVATVPPAYYGPLPSGHYLRMSCEIVEPSPDP